MRLTQKKLFKLVESEVRKMLSEEDIKLDVYTDEDGDNLEVHLDKKNISYTKDGSVYTIKIQDDTLDSSELLSRLSAIADFDKLGDAP